MEPSGSVSVGVLVRIADGAAVEVAQVDIPLRIKLQTETVDGTGTMAHVVVDYPALTHAIRRALHEAADNLPHFPED